MLLRCNFSVFVIFTTTPLLAASRNCHGNGDRDPKPNPNPNPEHAVLSNTDNPISENQLQRPRKRCCPYDFDSSLCRIVDDRLLCGFNRNVGYPNSKDDPIDLQGGCRMRGGRLECGYQQGPYTNIRRPPAWYDEALEKEVELQSEEKPADRVESDEAQPAQLKLHRSPSTRKHKGVTRCVEIHERIVCKDM